MHYSIILTVYKKELKDTLRDRRTLMVMLLVPILLYPALLLLMGQIMTAGSQKLENEKSAITYIEKIPAELDSLLKKEDKLEIVSSSDPATDLQSGNIRAYLEIVHFPTTDSLFIYFDAVVDRSRLARERLESVVQIYKTNISERRLRQFGLDLAVLEPIGIRKINTASPTRMGGMIIGSIIPILLLVTIMLGAMYPAIDLTAGEKERGTLETILTVPVMRLELLMGKFFTVSTIALITGLLNLLSISLVYALGLIQMGALSGKLEFTFSPLVISILFLSILPLSLFISAMMLSVSLFARSFKDAQNLITPLFFILLMPALLTMAPGIELTNFLALVPILNICLLFKEIMLLNFAANLIFLVFLSNTFYAILAILIFSKLFNAEELLLGEGKFWQFALKRSEIQSAKVLEPASAMLVLAVILLFFFYIASIVQIKFIYWGMFITQWGLLFLPVLFAVWYNKVNFKKALNLRGFQPLALLGTVVLTLGGLMLAVWIEQLQVDFFPESAKIGEAMEKMLNLKETGFSLLGLLVFAVSPGICEELLFRGIILSAFKERFSPAFTIITIAVLFGIFHLHIFRFLPTALIGLFLTFIVYQTGSIYLGMIGHSIHNGMALMITSYPEIRQHFGWLAGEEPFSPIFFLLMILLLASGVFIVRYSSKYKK